MFSRLITFPLLPLTGAVKPKVNDSVRAKQEALRQQFLRGSQPSSQPKSTIKVSQSDEFKTKMMGIGAALQAGMAKGPPSFRKKKAPSTADHHEEDEEEEEEEKSDYVLPLTATLTNPDKRGELEKRGVGTFNKSWKKRMFILRGRDLFWLKSLGVSLSLFLSLLCIHSTVFVFGTTVVWAALLFIAFHRFVTKLIFFPPHPPSSHSNSHHIPTICRISFLPVWSV